MSETTISLTLKEGEQLALAKPGIAGPCCLFTVVGTAPAASVFLNKLNDALPAWVEVMDVVVVSADTQEKAIADKEEFGWNFDLCYGLTETQMRSLGLYVSEPLSEAETTGLFSEPGAFGIRPDGSLMLVDISNGPAARPDLDELLDGMKFNIENDRPVREQRNQHEKRDVRMDVPVNAAIK